jgi:hypothetical protein
MSPWMKPSARSSAIIRSGSPSAMWRRVHASTAGIPPGIAAASAEVDHPQPAVAQHHEVAGVRVGVHHPDRTGEENIVSTIVCAYPSRSASPALGRPTSVASDVPSSHSDTSTFGADATIAGTCRRSPTPYSAANVRCRSASAR